MISQGRQDEEKYFFLFDCIKGRLFDKLILRVKVEKKTMTDPEQNTPNSEASSQELLFALRRKQGSWVEWGQACQTLQKMGHKPQDIFEETGFEPVHQNQVIVGSQVYNSMLAAGISEPVQSHFQQKGSDILYELRILTQTERATAATFIVEKQLDVDAAKEVAKALKDFSRMRELPPGFSNNPGDALAYQCWKFARQKSDFQERSRLIAEGLKFATSAEARKQIEKLLTDFTVVAQQPIPVMPVYRFESSEELPRVLPVCGSLPLAAEVFQAVPQVQEKGAFQMINSTGNQTWVAIPGWQVICNAKDPVVVVGNSKELPTPLSGKAEEVLIVVDRQEKEWDSLSYFILEVGGKLQLQWFPEFPEVNILGKVVLIMRPKNIFDENYTNEPWQIDE